MRLQQILINLISNAIKFTSAGKVSTSIEIFDETATGISLMFKITDTGIGIPKEKQAIIFDAFVQAEDSTTRKFGGTGLGTAISKELVRLMGGEIGVESEEGRGSTFWFAVAFEKQYEGGQLMKQEIAAYMEPIQSMNFTDATILLVEDYLVNREVAAAHLKKLGCNIVVAENGKIAVEMFRELPIDLILMDVQMPEMDGYEATRIIRSDPRGATLPILGMTANAFEADIQKCLVYGMNDVITKPFRKAFFLQKVALWLSGNKTDM